MVRLSAFAVLPWLTLGSMISLKFPVTSVTLSEGSKCVLLNRAPDSVILWDIDSKETVREFHGHQQPQHVVRSCFGGADEAYVMSGSEGARLAALSRGASNARR